METLQVVVYFFGIAGINSSKLSSRGRHSWKSQMISQDGDDDGDGRKHLETRQEEMG